MKPNFNSVPDAQKYPPATAVTPQQMAESEKTIREAKTPEDRAAAEAIHQALCQSQHQQLLQIHQKRQMEQLMRGNP
jgi:hypothetical protein